MNLVGLLSNSSFRFYSKPLARKVGVHAAVLFSELAAKNEYFFSIGKLDEEGMFYASIDDIEYETSLTRRNQDSAISILSEIGLIVTKVKGMPAKRYFGFPQNCSEILAQTIGLQFGGFVQTSLADSYKQECTNRTNKFGGFVHVYNESKYENKEESKYEREREMPNHQKNAKEKSTNTFNGIEFIDGISLPLSFQSKSNLIDAINKFLLGKNKKGKVRTKSDSTIKRIINEIDIVLSDYDEDTLVESINFANEQGWESVTRFSLGDVAKRLFMAKKEKTSNSVPARQPKYVSW